MNSYGINYDKLIKHVGFIYNGRLSLLDCIYCFCTYRSTWHVCGGQRTSFSSLFSLLTIWVLGMKLSSSGLTANIFTHGDNLTTLQTSYRCGKQE